MKSDVYLACPCCNHPTENATCECCGHEWHPQTSATETINYAGLCGRNYMPGRHLARKHQERVAALQDYLHQGMRVLEVGCAEGSLGIWAKTTHTLTYWGIEPSLDREMARRHLDAVFPSIQSLPPGSSGFDAIIAFHVLEHIPDLSNEILSWRKLLTVDGWLMVEVPLRGGHPDVIKDANPEHLHQFSWPSLASLLERSGFDIHNMSRGHFESPSYPDSLRAMAKLRSETTSKDARLTARFKRVPQPFAVFGLGGDFRNYLEPLLGILNPTALLDNDPSRVGTLLSGVVIERYSSERHGDLSILVSSIRHEEAILASLRQAGHSEKQIFTLAQLLEPANSP